MTMTDFLIANRAGIQLAIVILLLVTLTLRELSHSVQTPAFQQLHLATSRLLIPLLILLVLAVILNITANNAR